MSRTRFLKFALLLLLIAAPLAAAQADCPETASGFHTYLGVDVTVPSFNRSRQPEIRNLDLLRVQVVWVPPDPDIRFRDQYVIDIDWKNQTHTNVDVWDGELQAIREWDIDPVILKGNTNFETGQVHIETCRGVLDSVGPVLVFAYYGYDGSIRQEYTKVAPLLGKSAVPNVTVSDAITGSFNNKLDQRMIEDVELATGVLPGNYLAQSFLFQNLAPIIPLLDRNPPLFFNAKNALVYQNQVYVTGSEASASVPLSLAAVLSDGKDILDGDRRVRNLEQYIGTVRFQSRFIDRWIGYNLIIEARPDLRVETQPCEDGYTTLTADFIYPSEVSGRIVLVSDDFEWGVEGPSINERVSCDNDYRLTATRSFLTRADTNPLRFGGASSGPIWVPVVTKGTLAKVEYRTRRTGDALYVALTHPRDEIASPSVEAILKVWDAPNIESLYGTHTYYCDKPGDSRVDSIDEIAARWTNLLTVEEQASFGPFADVDFNNQAWTDVDGDGTICDGDEFGPDGDRAIVAITLAVYPSD